MPLSAIRRPAISVHFVQVILARATALGVSEKVLLEAVRLSLKLVADSRTRITPIQLGALIRLVWQELDDELMGFGIAPHRFGSFALMARHMVASATLGEALRYSVRFYNLTSEALRWRMEEGVEARLTVDMIDDRNDQDHFIEELLLLIWHRFCNWLIGERVPLICTEFRFEQPVHAAEHRIMFPGSLKYGGEYSSLVFDPAWLAAPIVRTPRELHQYLPRLPDEWFIKQDFDHSVSDRVLKAMGERNDFPSLTTLASAWHISARTLHRKLQREGSSYRRLLEQVRRERAIGLLLEGNTLVGDIARTLDMTEPAFSRAFKEWTGMTPLAYRKARN